MFCATCSASLADDARFCGRCGTARPVSPAGETREFFIPLPEDSPFSGPLGVGQKDVFLTREHLRKIGVNRPKPADYLFYQGLTYIWTHHSEHVRVRVTEIEAEGWEVDGDLEPKRDFYDILTTQGIRDRIQFDEVQTRGKPAYVVKGFTVQMRRGKIPDQGTPEGA